MCLFVLPSTGWESWYFSTFLSICSISLIISIPIHVRFYVAVVWICISLGSFTSFVIFWEMSIRLDPFSILNSVICLIDIEVWKTTLYTDFVISSSMLSLLGQDKTEKCWKTSVRVYYMRTFCWYFMNNMINNPTWEIFTLLSTLVPLSERIIIIKRSSIIAHPLLIIIHHNLLIWVPQIIFITYNVAEKWTHDSIFNFWAWSTDFKIKYWANQRNCEAGMAFFLTEINIVTIYQVSNLKKSLIYSHPNSIWRSLKTWVNMPP